MTTIVGTGIGRNSAQQEREERERILENYKKRATEQPTVGTHSLGREFATEHK